MPNLPKKRRREDRFSLSRQPLLFAPLSPWRRRRQQRRRRRRPRRWEDEDAKKTFSLIPKAGVYRTVRPKRKRRFEEFSLRYPLFVVFNSHSKYYSSLFLRTSLEDLFFLIPQGGVFERSHRVVQGDFGGGEKSRYFLLSSFSTFIPTRGGKGEQPEEKLVSPPPRFVFSVCGLHFQRVSCVGGVGRRRGGRPKQVEV